jgi:hypothetical protein
MLNFLPQFFIIIPGLVYMYFLKWNDYSYSYYLFLC